MIESVIVSTCAITAIDIPIKKHSLLLLSSGSSSMALGGFNKRDTVIVRKRAETRLKSDWVLIIFESVASAPSIARLHFQLPTLSLVRLSKSSCNFWKVWASSISKTVFDFGSGVEFVSGELDSTWILVVFIFIQFLTEIKRLWKKSR